MVCKLHDVSLSGTGIEFISYIELDWEFDIQLCRLTFRYKGGLVNRFGPLDCDSAIFEDPPSAHKHDCFLEDSANGANVTRMPLEKVLIRLSIHDWPNKFVIGPDGTSKALDRNRPPMLIAIKGYSRVRTCFRTWYWRNGFHRIPCPSPYSHISQLKHSQVLFAIDDGEFNAHLQSWTQKETVEELCRDAFTSCGKYLILA